MTSPTTAWPNIPAPYSAGSSDGANRSLRRRSPVRIVLGIVLTLLLLAFGVAGVSAIVIYGDYSVQYPARFAAPNHVGDLVRASDSESAKLEAATVAALRAKGLARPFAAQYVDPRRPQRRVFVAGSTQRLLLPMFQADKAFKGMTGAGLVVTGTKRVDSGELGGTVQCGTAIVAGAKVPVCAWADHGSLGIVQFTDTSMDDAIGEVPVIRVATIIRG